MISDLALEFLGRGGKKLRPRLCQAAFDSLGGTGDISPVLEAVECFHKASLVHDDIQDGDEERYGRPAVWKEHGVAVAIAVGDWLVAHGYRLIAKSGFANVARMLEATVDSHVRLCEGQGDELMNGEGGKVKGDATAFYLSVCERKTGEAFALAAQLGALAAGVSAEVVEKCRRYGLTYGILFQICDDIADKGETPELLALRKEYEDKTALYRDECALGVW